MFDINVWLNDWIVLIVSNKRDASTVINLENDFINNDEESR